MLKEKAPRVSRRAFLALAAAATTGVAAYKIEKQLSFFKSLPKPEFSKEEIKQFRDAEVLLVFFPGGWGNTSLEEDPSWQKVLFKIKEELENRGYKTMIIEELRQENPLSSSSAAKNTAIKMKQLMEVSPSLKIVLTGRSTGASFIEKVLQVLPENGRILAIEATRPFAKRNPSVAPEKTLVIENPKFDPLQEGNIWRILIDTFPPHIFIGEGGDLGIGRLRVDWQLPGHHSCCSWNSEIANEVEEFLDTHFPSKR